MSLKFFRDCLEVFGFLRGLYVFGVFVGNWGVCRYLLRLVSI